jgi:hypothetical protein
MWTQDQIPRYGQIKVEQQTYKQQQSTHERWKCNNHSVYVHRYVLLTSHSGLRSSCCAASRLVSFRFNPATSSSPGRNRPPGLTGTQYQIYP